MDIEINALRIFVTVMDQKSFSAAAKALKITQPTVSQHIARLESEIKGRLFERVGHSIIPTPLAKELLDFSVPLLENVRSFQDRLQEQRVLPKGLVRYGMPESCQWTPHYRKVMSQIKEFPDLHFKIEIAPSESIIDRILRAELDFGFIVGERITPDLTYERFADEVYSAVATDISFFNPLKNTKDLDGLRLITYPGWEGFFTTWAKACGFEKNIKKLHEPHVYIGTLAGAIHATQEGAGVAILPSHCVAKELQTGKLKEWHPQKKGAIASSPIHIAKRLGDHLPKRSLLILEMLKKSKLELG